MSRHQRIFTVSFVLILAASFALPAYAAGTTIHVTTKKDIVANDGKCSLREAVTAANSDTASGAAPGECPAGTNTGPDNILLKKKTTYTLTIDGTDEDANANGDLDITSDLSITGSKATKIKQTVRSRVLDVLSGATATVTGITLTGGHTADGTMTVRAASGGGIHNAGTLTLDRSTVTKNATGDGTFASSTIGYGGSGGGIENEGALTITRSTISSNTTGAGVDGLSGVSVTPAGGGGPGGGIANAHGATLLMSFSHVTGNHVGPSGDTPPAFAPSSSGTLGGSGGGIGNSGTATIDHSSFTKNVAGSGGGGGGEEDFSGMGDGSPGGAGGGGGAINSNGTLTLRTSSIADNQGGTGGQGGLGQANGSGGVGGDGGAGGGLNVTGPTIIDSDTISSNHGGTGGPGGSNQATPAVTASSGNVGGGGGLSVAGISPTALFNSTFSGNTGLAGGAINTSGTINLNNVTIARNRADGGGGIFNTGTVNATNTVVALNTASESGPDCFGTIASGGYNLVKNTSDCTGFTATGDITGQDPKLGGLASNGGPTKTDALKSGSPAINAGNPGTPTGTAGTCEPTDQRGVTRVTCDIGAYEKKPS